LPNGISIGYFGIAEFPVEMEKSSELITMKRMMKGITKMVEYAICKKVK
jgi:hypothetical protein